jgi:hypothetical protein
VVDLASTFPHGYPTSQQLHSKIVGKCAEDKQQIASPTIELGCSGLPCQVQAAVHVLDHLVGVLTEAVCTTGSWLLCGLHGTHSVPLASGRIGQYCMGSLARMLVCVHVCVCMGGPEALVSCLASCDYMHKEQARGGCQQQQQQQQQSLGNLCCMDMVRYITTV